MKKDITNFEERLKASTNSVDDTLNPKLSLSARQKDSKGSSSRTSISQSESKQGADSKRFLIDELSSTRKRDSSRGKAKNVLSIPESEGKQVNKFFIMRI